MATPKKSGPAAKKTAAAKPPAAKKPAKPAAKKTEKSGAAKPAAKKRAATPKAAATKPAAKKAPAAKAVAKKAPVAKAEPAEPELDDHDHDHDHEHEHDEEQDRLDVERMGAALMALDDDALRHGLEQMTEKTRSELATQLQLPRATMHLGDALIPLVRRKLHTVSPDRQLQAAFGLSECANDDTVESLGDRAEDPSLDDLREVLPSVVDEHGAPLVTAMLAAYSASNAPCRSVMRELLETDERFVIGSPVAVEGPPAAIAVFKPVVVADDKREQRREAKAAKRAAEVKAREARAAGEASRRAAVHQSKRRRGK
jgi:hypothetical protein